MPKYRECPLIEIDQSPLGRVHTDFQRLGQQLISQGVPAEDVRSDRVDVELSFREGRSEDLMTTST